MDRDPQIVDLDRQIEEAVDEEDLAYKQKLRRNALKRLEKQATVSYRVKWMKKRRDEKILTKGDLSPPAKRDPDVLNELIPEKGRLAERMSRDTPLDLQEIQEAMHDMITLLRLDHSTFYLPTESPEDGRCPGCDLEMKTSVQLLLLLVT